MNLKDVKLKGCSKTIEWLSPKADEVPVKVLVPKSTNIIYHLHYYK